MGHSWSEIPSLEDLVVRFLGLSCCPKSESKSDSPTQGKPLPEEPPPRLPAWVLGALGRLRKLEHLRVGNRWPLSASASQRRTEVGGLFFSRPPGPWMDSPNETNERGGGRQGGTGFCSQREREGTWSAGRPGALMLPDFHHPLAYPAASPTGEEAPSAEAAPAQG